MKLLSSVLVFFIGCASALAVSETGAEIANSRSRRDVEDYEDDDYEDDDEDDIEDIFDWDMIEDDDDNEDDDEEDYDDDEDDDDFDDVYDYILDFDDDDFIADGPDLENIEFTFGKEISH
ncbi:unnamed protein product [Oikopleura dioica]|uniref:Uncharacterized protein n=1 Tax=Oikopleura dioica TaxID=34765 RepID=E4WU73_OIKDI|nr:unnamed protein product [Oikopleura dioica]